MAKHIVRLTDVNERDLAKLCKLEGKSPEAIMVHAIRFQLAIRLNVHKTAKPETKS